MDTILVGVISSIMLAQGLAQDLCVSPATNTFLWAYDAAREGDWEETIWYSNMGDVIMRIDQSGAFFVTPDPPFAGRLSEDTSNATNNAGMVLSDVISSDNGVFSVTIQFSTVPNEVKYNTTLAVSDDNFESEVIDNSHIMVDGERKAVDDTTVHDVGSSFLFSFIIDDKTACIPAPDISIYNGDGDLTRDKCSGYSCEVDVTDTSQIYVIVEKLPMTTRLPSADGFYTFNGAVIQRGSLLSTLLLSVLVLLSSRFYL